MMQELNPNHPVTRQVHDQWHKICALLMMKMGVTQVVITENDIAQLKRDSGVNIMICPSKKDNTITVELMDDATSIRLARLAGGLPT